MSMPMDPFGGTGIRDPIRVLQELSQRVAALEAQVRQRQGVPVTQASGAFRVPSTSTPDPPPSGAYLYASGSELRWRSAAGADYSLIPPAVPSADFVANPTGYTVDPAPSTYSQSHAQNLVLGLYSVGLRLDQALTAFKSAGLMDLA